MSYQWCCGWNMPGYLPDAEPCDCETWEGARDTLIWELELEDCESDEERRACEAVIAELRAATAGEELNTTARAFGYVFWIVRATTPFNEADQ